MHEWTYGSSDDINLSIVLLDEPSPTAALNSGKGAVKSCDEVIKRAIFLVEGILDGARGIFILLGRRQVFPE